MPTDRPTHDGARSWSLEFFDPDSPDHQYIDSISEEAVRVFGPRINWWSVDIEASAGSRDSIDELYQSSPINVFRGPTDVRAFLEKSPVIEELTRQGILDIEEITLIFNISDVERRLGPFAPPKSGDIFAVEYPAGERDASEQVFFKVVSVIPADMVFWRYTNYVVAAERTAMEDVPDEIRVYMARGQGPRKDISAQL